MAKTKAGNNIMLLCIYYRPPNISVGFWTVSSGKNNIIPVGDFNADHPTRHDNWLKLVTLSSSFALYIHEPIHSILIKQLF